MKKIIKIFSSISGVIPTGSYENIKPSYSMEETIELEEKETWDENKVKEYKRKSFKIMKDELKLLYKEDKDEATVDRIKKQSPNIRIREKDGKKYPSVTSIINWNFQLMIPEYQMEQYTSRGKIVHAIMENYLMTGEDLSDSPDKLPNLTKELIVVKQGDCGLDWRDCNWRGFLSKHKIEVETIEQEIFDDSYAYSGKYDIKGKYEGKKTLFDIKTTSNYSKESLIKMWKQLSAYAVKLPDIERMAIIPLTTKVKSGYSSIIIEKDIQRYFKMFLLDRKKFKEIYDI